MAPVSREPPGRVRRRPAGRRGLTLVELMVSVGVGAVVLLGVLSALSASQGQYAEQTGLSSLQASLRTGATQLEQALARAGYGIDPNLAFITRNQLGLVPGLAPTAASLMDNSGPYGSDSLIILYRDPLFRRVIRANSANTNAFTMDTGLPAGESLLKGQRLLLLCEGSGDSAYVTVENLEPGNVVRLAATTSPPFNQQSKLTSWSCFNSGTAIATRVEMRHFFIAWMVEPGTNAQRPALLVRRGVDVNANGTAGEMPNAWPAPGSTTMGDAELVALDVEQLQVSYVLHRPNRCPPGSLGTCVNHEANYSLDKGPDSDQNFVFGDDAASAAEVPWDTDLDDFSTAPSADLPTSPNWSGNMALWKTSAPQRPPLLTEFNTCAPLSPDNPSYCGYGAIRRFTAHVGNVRMVRYALAARSSRSERDMFEGTALRPDGLVVGPLSTMENLTEPLLVGSQGRFNRGSLRGSVSLRNMFHRRHFVPPVDAASGLNVDGG